MLTASRLWQLTLSLYQQPGVEPCCLQMQHEHGAEVNMILLLALFQAQGMRIDYKPLRYAAASLQTPLQQWRMLRRALKGKLSTDRYAELLSHELVLEKQLQQQLLTALPQAQHAGASQMPLNDYLESIGMTQSPSVAQLLLSQAHIILDGSHTDTTRSSGITEEFTC